MKRKKSALPDTTFRRLRSVPSYFFLLWRWGMWFYALFIILFFKRVNGLPFYKEELSPFHFYQISTVLLIVTFLQSLTVTLYAPVFRIFLPRLLRILFKKNNAGRITELRETEDEEMSMLSSQTWIYNKWGNILLYGLDMTICGLVTYYSGPFASPPFGNGSPFYRYGISTAFAAALTYRYQGALLAAFGYDLFILLGILVPAPGAPLYHSNIMDILGSLVDTPVAALLSAYCLTLLHKYAQSKKKEQETNRRLRALSNVSNTLLKTTSDRQQLLQQSVISIQKGGHFGRLIIALVNNQPLEGRQQNALPHIEVCLKTNLLLEEQPDQTDNFLDRLLQQKQVIWNFEPLVKPKQRDSGIARLYIPLFRDGRLQLILGAESIRTTPFGERQREFLTIAGAQLLVALDNIRLTEQALSLVAATERNRMAREIHDGIAQLIYMFSLQAETCETQAQRIAATSKENTELIDPLIQRISKLVTISKQALWETRSYMFTLKPLMIGHSSLTQMLTRQTGEFSAISHLSTHLTVIGQENEIITHEQRHTQRYATVGTALFRIAQEALTNAYKHAQATHIDVELQFQPDQIILKIQDDGQGLPASLQQNMQEDISPYLYSGYGLAGMRERVSELGGTFEILPSAPSGVTIEVALPL